MREVKEGQVYKHFKNIIVEVLCVAKDAENLKEMVFYKHIDNGDIWVRPIEEFLSEVNHEKYPDVKQKYRFELQ